MAPRYPKGLTQTRYGWMISLRVHGDLQQKRFKRSFTREQMEDKLATARKTWPAAKGKREVAGFTGDVARYLADYFTGRPGFAERKRHLDLWTAALLAALREQDPTVPDDFERELVTNALVAHVLNGWRAAGLGPETCNKRRTALLAMYHALDGKGAANPVREIKKFRPPDPLPRGVAFRLIEKALATLPACKTESRLRVMAYSGARPGQVMRLTEDHWAVRARQLTIPGTDKGRGTKTYTIPVSDALHDALQAFFDRGADGAFTWAPMGRMWKEAWIAATTGQSRLELRGKCAGLAAPVPYDMRHSFATAVYRKTGDLKAVKELLGHSTLRMTERYMLAAVPQRQRSAIALTFPKGRKLTLKVDSPRKRSRSRAG